MGVRGNILNFVWRSLFLLLTISVLNILGRVTDLEPVPKTTFFTPALSKLHYFILALKIQMHSRERAARQAPFNMMCTVQLADSERVPNHVNLQLWWHPDKFPFTLARSVVSTRHPVSKVAARSVTFLTIQSQTSRHFVWHFPRNRFCPIFLIHLIWLDFALFNIKSQIHLCNRLWLIPCLDKERYWIWGLLP